MILLVLLVAGLAVLGHRSPSPAVRLLARALAAALALVLLTLLPA